MQIYTIITIWIKLDLYVLKEYFISTLCEKNVGEGLTKSSEMVVKMRKGVGHQNPKSIPGMTTFSMKACLASLARSTDKCIDFSSVKYCCISELRLVIAELCLTVY